MYVYTCIRNIIYINKNLVIYFLLNNSTWFLRFLKCELGYDGPGAYILQILSIITSTSTTRHRFNMAEIQLSLLTVK